MTNLVVLMYGGMALAVIVLAVLTLLSAWAINARKWHTFSLVMAGLQCLSFPFGTALGIFTFIVLLRPSVLFLYERKHAPAA